MKILIYLLSVYTICNVNAFGDIFVTNLDPKLDDSTTVIFSSQSIGTSFTTGNFESRIDTVKIYAAYAPASNGEFFLSIRGDKKGLPGSILSNGNLTGSTAPTSSGYWIAQEYEYVAHNLILEPNSTYWLVAESDATFGHGYVWPGTHSTGDDSSYEWSIGNFYAVGHYGSDSWSSTASAGNPSTAMFQIEGSVIPEPSSAILLCLSGCLIVFKVRYLRRR